MDRSYHLVLAQGRQLGKAWIVRGGRYETTHRCARAEGG
jgi:hypothetical protein